MNKKLKVAILSNGISQHTLNRLNIFCAYPHLDLYFLHQSAQMKNNSKLPNERFYQYDVIKGKNKVGRGLIGLNIIFHNIFHLLKINPDVIFKIRPSVEIIISSPVIIEQIQLVSNTAC